MILPFPLSPSFPFSPIQSVCIFWTIDKRIEIFPSRLIESGNGLTMGSLGTVWHSLTLSAQTRPALTMEPLRRSITSVIRDYHNRHYASPLLPPPIRCCHLPLSHVTWVFHILENSPLVKEQFARTIRGCFPFPLFLPFPMMIQFRSIFSAAQTMGLTRMSHELTEHRFCNVIDSSSKFQSWRKMFKFFSANLCNDRDLMDGTAEWR